MYSLRSPKQKKQRNLAQALSYYAAFSEEFVKDVITQLKISSQQTILDPWNGSGTTTTIASKMGIKSYGYDLNPAVRMIAKARLATLKELRQTQDLLEKYFSQACEKVKVTDLLPALTAWFHPASVRHLSRLKALTLEISNETKRAIIDAVISTALRRQLSQFKSKNPTWLKTPRTQNNQIELDIQGFEDSALSALQELYSYAPDESKYLPSIEIEDARRLPLEDQSIDAVITSPPYCTRIDYAISTIVELAWLGYDRQYIKGLRSKLTGSPTIQNEKLVNADRLPPKVWELLEKIRNHESKASSTYYYKTFFQFFLDMQLSFKELHRVLKPGGDLCIVVQDSFYKDIHVNLSYLFTEMLKVLRFEFDTVPVSYSARGLNIIHGHRDINEVTLTCRKIA